MDPEDDLTGFLPDEVFLKIFRKLSEQDWVCSAALVCWRWHRLATDRRVWRPFHHARFPPTTDPDQGRQDLCWDLLDSEVQEELDEDVDEYGNVIEWREELLNRTQDLHKHWIFNTKTRFVYEWLPDTQTSKVALRGRNVCFCRGSGLNSAFVLFPDASERRIVQVSPLLPRAVAWVADERLALLSHDSIKLTDMTTEGKSESTVSIRDAAAIESPVMTHDPINNLVCVAGSSELVCLDYRARVEAARMNWGPAKSTDAEATPVTRYVGHGGRRQPHLVCVVGSTQAALWDLRKPTRTHPSHDDRGPISTVVPTDPLALFSVASFHDRTLLVGQEKTEHRQTTYTLMQFELEPGSGGMLGPAQLFPDTHPLGKPFRSHIPPTMQFDRLKYVVCKGHDIIVVDRLSGRSSDPFPLCSQGPRYLSSCLQYSGGTLMAATDRTMELWDFDDTNTPFSVDCLGSSAF